MTFCLTELPTPKIAALFVHDDRSGGRFFDSDLRRTDSAKANEISNAGSSTGVSRSTCPLSFMMLPRPGAVFKIDATNGDRTLIASVGLLFPMSLIPELHLDDANGRLSREIPENQPSDAAAKSSKDPIPRGSEPSSAGSVACSMFLMTDVESFIELLPRVRLAEPDAAFELVRQV